MKIFIHAHLLNHIRSVALIIVISGISLSFGQFSAGPNSPASLTEQYAGCLSCPGTSWMAITDAAAPDSLFAFTQLPAYPTCFQGTCYYSRGMMAGQFGFSIPLTAVITGIRAEVLRKAGNQNISDSTIRLLVGGIPAGQNKAAAINWPLSALYASYGDSVSLWGLSLTPAQVNDPDFGLMVQPYNKSFGVATFITASVDHVRLTVYYTTASGYQQQQHSQQVMQAWFDSGSESIYIRHPGNIVSGNQIQLYNGTGQLVLSEKITDSSVSCRLNVQTLPDGFYVLRIVYGANSNTKTVVLSRR